jgi:hypothetical protein
LISEADECRLDLGKPLMRSHVVLELGLSVEAFEAFLTFLVDPERCGLVRLEGGVLTTERTQEDLAKVQEMREKHSKVAKGQRRNDQGRFHRKNGVGEPLDHRSNGKRRTVKNPNGPSSTVERLEREIREIRLGNGAGGAGDNRGITGDGAGSPSQGASAPSEERSREERIAAQKKVLEEQARRLLGERGEEESGDEDPF